MNPMPTLQDLAKVAALRSEVTLQPHQQKVVDRINSGDKRLLLYHGLGSGKSLSSLAAAEAAGDDYDVVVPAALRPNYQKEVAKFTEGSDPEVLSYTGIGAGKTFQTSPKTIIFDEAHRLRNPGTASTQAATELANKAENLLLLTGTPITNSPTDLAPLLSMLRKEKITPEQFERNYIGHRKVYPTWLSRLTGRGVGEEAYVKNEDNLREQLKGLIDYQPSKTPEGVNVNEETVRVPLSRGQSRIQQAVRDKIPPEYAWKLDKEYPLTRDELSRMNSFLTGLRQSSLSTQPFRGDRDPLNAFDESSKLQKAFGDLQETLKTDPRKKALVYSNYIDAGLGPYAAALQRAKIPYGMYHGSMPVEERKKALQDYNEGTLKALLLGPAAAEGISTQGTSLIQLLDPHWHESRGRQAEGRGLRFDSHEGLPPELKNVAIKRYLSESQDPSFIMSLLGARRQRTGDEILERLAANKEQLNNQFRKILQEEGSSMNKQSSHRRNVPIGIAYDPEMHAALIRWENAKSKRLSPGLQRQVQANLGWTGKQVADDLDLVELLMEQEDAKEQNMKATGPIQALAKMAACGDTCRCGQTENECTCSDVEKLARLVAKQASSGAWTRAEGKSESGGLNAKGRASLKAQGQNIKPPVTEDNPTGERAGRKSSFCARMGGMKKKLTSSETANDPDSRINKALRKWNC